jgi:hypothetical protein
MADRRSALLQSWPKRSEQRQDQQANHCDHQDRPADTDGIDARAIQRWRYRVGPDAS